jgi:hypothetical protein
MKTRSQTKSITDLNIQSIDADFANMKPNLKSYYGEFELELAME